MRAIHAILASAITVAALLTAVRATALPPVPRYQLIDVGTFGGPHAEVNGPARAVTSRGAVLGLADTSVSDADYPNDGLCGGFPYIVHAFSWHPGHLRDLGALPGNNCSGVFEVNSRGLGVGFSETGTFDPRANAPTLHPVLFRDGKVIDIGTLPGGSEGFAFSVNNHGQAIGVSNTGRPGPTFPDFFDWGGQVHGFVWQHGVMRDLGTLGGPGAVPGRINEQGQVSGDSYVDASINASTGSPTVHPFLWQNGHMRDLGSLGGATSTSFWMNERGQVVGRATLPGDTITHPFVWDGHRLRDLGTLGGTFAEANRINDHGVIAGGSWTSGNETFHTVMWRDGVMTDLSPGPDQCTFPEWINNRDEIVGATCGGQTALLWHNGTRYDLNTLVGNTDVHLGTASYIDDRGRIVALGELPNGDSHVFLLQPRRHP